MCPKNEIEFFTNHVGGGSYEACEKIASSALWCGETMSSKDCWRFSALKHNELIFLWFQPFLNRINFSAFSRVFWMPRKLQIFADKEIKIPGYPFRSIKGAILVFRRPPGDPYFLLDSREGTGGRKGLGPGL